MMNPEISNEIPNGKSSSCLGSASREADDDWGFEERYEFQQELSRLPLSKEHNLEPVENKVKAEKEINELYGKEKELSYKAKEKLSSGMTECSPLAHEEKEKKSNLKKEESNHKNGFEYNPAAFVPEQNKQITRNSESKDIDFLIMTKIPNETRHFLWTIHEFSSIPFGKELYSPGIYYLYSSWCRLKLVKNERGFCLYYVNTLQSTQKSESDTTMRFPLPGSNRSFSFNAPMNDTESISHENVFSSTLEFDISATDIKKKHIINWSVTCSGSKDPKCEVIGEYVANQQTVLPKDIFILDCHLRITMPPISHKTCYKHVTEKSARHSWIKLSTDLKYMYQNSMNADVILIAGTDEIRANKSILIARCPFFKKMFQNETKESEKNFVEITDIPKETLKKLVEFLYTGKLEENDENFRLQHLHDLYCAANKYEVIDLQSICSKLLLLITTVDNATSILTWAHKCNDKELKSQLIHFIKNNFDSIVDEDSWASFVADQTLLASEIVKICFKELKKTGLFF